AFLLDQYGVILAHPDSKMIGTKTFAELPVWSEVRNNEKGFTSYIYNKVDKYMAYYKSPLTGWITVGSMDQSELSSDVDIVLRTLLVFILLIIVGAVPVSLIVTRTLSRNIFKIKDIISRASDGDFTHRVDVHSGDEIGTLSKDFNVMISKISEMIGNVGISSKRVFENSLSLTAMAEETTASVSEISKGMEEVSQGVLNQAASTKEVSNSMDGLSKGLDVIVNAAGEMSDLSSSTYNLSSKGLEMVKILVEKSNETRVSSVVIADIVNDMNTSTHEINVFSDTIKEITEQTNLLSLNASIEAARAGEAGKGFAVVAGEIRRLAEQSKNSAFQIRNIVENIQAKSMTAVNAIEGTKLNVEQQEKAVNETTEIFNKIFESINGLTSVIAHMKDSMLGITRQKDEVVVQVENISSVSEQVASVTEEVNASSGQISEAMDEFTKDAVELQNLANKLEEELKKFRI
ncbi:MAG: methyl-accepting chemotaxis protein, partial [Bacillota bacterium]|nr:methyl-accepting chemotaxis protein [Bacillota bacterium]